MSISKDGKPITSVKEWETLAGPKRTNQWAEGRSAMEAARAWLAASSTGMPVEVLASLEGNGHFGPVLGWTAEPEVRLAFDRFGGEPRNSDLVVEAEDSHGHYLIAVEAKADETFGETVRDVLAAAVERWLENPASNGVARVEQLAAMLFGPRLKDTPHLKYLRYQLLTASAGALCEAERRGFSRAVLLIQEFRTEKTDDAKHEANAADLDAFVKRLSGGVVTAAGEGILHGPFEVTGKPQMKLYLGKVYRNLRAGETGSQSQTGSVGDGEESE